MLRMLRAISSRHTISAISAISSRPAISAISAHQFLRRVPPVGITENGAVERLLACGYKVGRIEQLGRPEQAKSSHAASVIQRKLASVLTPSTLNLGNIGPQAVHLLALKEDEDFEMGRNLEELEEQVNVAESQRCLFASEDGGLEVDDGAFSAGSAVSAIISLGDLDIKHIKDHIFVDGYIELVPVILDCKSKILSGRHTFSAISVCQFLRRVRQVFVQILWGKNNVGLKPLWRVSTDASHFKGRGYIGVVCRDVNWDVRYLAYGPVPAGCSQEAELIASYLGIVTARETKHTDITLESDNQGVVDVLNSIVAGEQVKTTKFPTVVKELRGAISSMERVEPAKVGRDLNKPAHELARIAKKQGKVPTNSDLGLQTLRFDISLMKEKNLVSYREALAWDASFRTW